MGGIGERDEKMVRRGWEEGGRTGGRMGEKMGEKIGEKRYEGKREIATYRVRSPRQTVETDFKLK
jgi:hypothetical protein